MRKLFKILIIIFAILAVVGGVLSYLYYDSNSPIGSTLNAKVLVLCIDPSEGRPGPGSVDMAFAVDLKDGNVDNVTPIYPGGMTHPNASAPDYVKTQGLYVLVLHDSCWWNNTTYDAKMAQEIVEYNTGIKTDVVVMVKPDAIDAVIQSVGGVNVEGQGYVNNNSITFLRDEQENNMSRGNAVESIANSIRNASKDKTNKTNIVNAITAQYQAGNIIVVPDDFAYRFITAEALNQVFG